MSNSLPLIEQQVFELASQGIAVSEIALRLNLETDRAKYLLRSVRRKTGLPHTSEIRAQPGVYQQYHRLGKLCSKGHSYNGLNRSLRYVNSGGCVECQRDRRKGLPRGLSAIEQQIYELANQGLTYKQIAAKVYLSPRTVSVHINRIRKKVDLPKLTDIRRRSEFHEQRGWYLGRLCPQGHRWQDSNFSLRSHRQECVECDRLGKRERRKKANA